MKILAFGRKLMLKTDTETFLRLSWLFFSELNFQQFLGSNYTHHFIERFDIHSKLAGIEDLGYSKYFDEEDTNLMIRILLSNICSYRIKGQLRGQFRSMFKVDEEDAILPVFPVIHILGGIVSDFTLGVFETEEELRKVVLLRDKMYAFAISIAGRALSKWEVVERIDDVQKKKIYLSAYMEAIDYFLKSELTKITDRIREAAKEKGISFDRSYDRIGQLHTPPKVLKSEMG